MKLISWNVNGLRACMDKGFRAFFADADADIFCIQETKMQEGQAEVDMEGYTRYMNSAEKKGYSGTLIWAKTSPLSCRFGLLDGLYNDEGRVITLEYDGFFIVNAYVPNSQDELKRLDYRMVFEDRMREYLQELDRKKPVIYCGDLNVAHERIDIRHPDANTGNAGFTPQERNKMTQLLGIGLKDTFRTLYPEKIQYSWWSYRFHARENNAGWRLDYFIVSDRLMKKVRDSVIRTEVTGSDHCPVELDIDLQ